MKIASYLMSVELLLPLQSKYETSMEYYYLENYARKNRYNIEGRLQHKFLY